MQSNTTGLSNVAIGTFANANNTEGEKNTAIGANAGVAENYGIMSNTTAIGYDATTNGSNQVQIGDDNIRWVYLGRRSAPDPGEVAASLYLYGDVNARATFNSSDGRLKKDIMSVSEGLGLINDLNPVSYRRVGGESDSVEMGLVAQEVRATLGKHGLNSGMVRQSSEDGYLFLRYNDLLAPMIRAIQELDEAAAAKDTHIASLQEQLQAQRKDLESQREELLAMIQSQQKQIAQLQRMAAHQFAAN